MVICEQPLIQPKQFAQSTLGTIAIYSTSDFSGNGKSNSKGARLFVDYQEVTGGCFLTLFK